MMMRGMYLWVRRMHNQAIFFCDRALELNPKLVPALYIKGAAMGQSGQCERGITILDMALSLDHGLAPAWLIKGVLLCELKRFGEAIPCYDNVIASGPYYHSSWEEFNIGPQSKERYSEALHAKAFALLETGNTAQAMKEHQNAVRFDPENPLSKDFERELKKRSTHPG